MSAFIEPVRTVQDIVNAYIKGNRTASFICMTSAIRAIRTYMPDCQLCDRELETHIAAAAIDAGLPVSFDGNSGKQEAH